MALAVLAAGKEGGGRSLDKELASPGSGAYPRMCHPSRPRGVVEWEGDMVGVVNSVGRTDWMSSDSPGLKPRLSHTKLCDIGPNT